MSHFTRVCTQLRNIDTMKRALENLGYDVRAGNVHGFSNDVVQVDLIIKVDRHHEIGFKKEGDKIIMVADFWGLKMNRQAFLDKITQRYAYETVLEQAQAEGFQAVVEEEQPDGSIRLIMQRW